MNDRPRIFNERTARHTLEIVRRVEDQFYPSNHILPLWDRPVTQAAVGSLCISNGTISARVGNNAGSGNAILLTSNSGTITTQNGANNAPIVMGVFNMSSTTNGIPTNTFCIVSAIVGADVYVWSLDCGNP
jgi:hypothetical protein